MFEFMFAFQLFLAVNQMPVVFEFSGPQILGITESGEAVVTVPFMIYPDEDKPEYLNDQFLRTIRT